MKKYEKIYNKNKEEIDNYDKGQLYYLFQQDLMAGKHRGGWEEWITTFLNQQLNISKYISNKIYWEYF